MTHAELVERLNLERATGLPRWHVQPTPVNDPEHVTAARRAALEALRSERPARTYRHLRAA